MILDEIMWLLTVFQVSFYNLIKLKWQIEVKLGSNLPKVKIAG